jgi:hypothetical protein
MCGRFEVTVSLMIRNRSNTGRPTWAEVPIFCITSRGTTLSLPSVSGRVHFEYTVPSCRRHLCAGCIHLSVSLLDRLSPSTQSIHSYSACIAASWSPQSRRSIYPTTLSDGELVIRLVVFPLKLAVDCILRIWIGVSGVRSSLWWARTQSIFLFLRAEVEYLSWWDHRNEVENCCYSCWFFWEAFAWPFPTWEAQTFRIATSRESSNVHTLQACRRLPNDERYASLWWHPTMTERAIARNYSRLGN